jgi:PAS domain S-box-containing protein
MPDANSPLPDPESRFQAIFEQSPTSMQILASNGRTVQVNKAWRTLWDAPGEKPLSHFVLHTDYNVLADPQLRAKGITPYLEKAFAGESVCIPASLYDPAELGNPGRPRWVTATAHPIKDAAGRVQEVMLMHEDITDRVEAERSLRDSEARFRSLVTATSLMVWSTTPEGVAVKDSPSWRAVTGQTPEEWQNNGWLKAVHPDDREHAAAAFAQAITAGRVYETEYRLRRADGRYCWTSAKAVPVLNADGDIREWIGANSDISAVRTAIASLQENEARFRSIIEAMPQMVWSTRPDGHHEYYNQRWYDFTGAGAGATDGEEWAGIVHPDDRALAWKAWRHSLETGDPYEVQYRLRHRSGAYRWALGRALPLRSDTGEIIRWLGTCTDIHDQKMSEDAWREAARQKDDFLAMLAHELRNPLAPISAAAQMMELPRLDPEQIRKTSRIINRQVQHLIALIDDLLDVSRVTRGLVSIEKRALDVKRIASSALEQVSPLLQTKRQDLRVTLPHASAPVLGDEKRLVQVITNLLNNAVKYTPEGGSIHLTVELRDAQVLVCVTDDGIGIAPAFQPRVFDLFTQADRTADRTQGGLGLGLALVKSIIELHGGEVSCTSAGLGMGSVFTVALPRLPEEQMPQDKEAVAAGARTDAPQRIVIVDDNSDAATTLAMYLRMIGHDVQVELSSLDALARITATVPDVCILDIGLPDMDGYELAARLRAQRATSHIRLIAVTGYGQEQDRKKGMDAGFDHHLVKPVDAAKLALLLARQA